MPAWLRRYPSVASGWDYPRRADARLERPARLVAPAWSADRDHRQALGAGDRHPRRLRVEAQECPLPHGHLLAVDAFEDVPGLRFKAWISDEATERWGAIYLWESPEAADQELPSRVRALIGKDPDLGEEFDVEATIEGRFAVEELSRRGLAFE